MVILSVNAGSSSLKFQAFEMPEEKLLISGLFEKIGLEDSSYTIKLMEELIENKIVESLEDIKAIGHRAVQGGPSFNKTVEIDDDVIAKIKEFTSLAPIHNPAVITGIKAAKRVAPNALQTASFDTAFHQTIAEENYVYPVPYEWVSEYNVRKYGFHGTSHKYVSG